MVLIFGLGLNGGGLYSSIYYAKQGYDVLVTDLRNETQLASTLDKLKKYPNIRYRLGEHQKQDFIDADIVVKNPAIKRDNEFLSLCKGKITTDIALFLSQIINPLIAVTGSKGKSSTVSMINHVLSKTAKCYLGGNITVSPLSFLDNIQSIDTVILELSSFQLGDLKFLNKPIKPKISVITNILVDHQNYYHSMENYIDDKRFIYNLQDVSDISIFYYDSYGIEFSKQSGATSYFVSDKKLPDGINGIYSLPNDKVVISIDKTEQVVDNCKAENISKLFAMLVLYLCDVPIDVIVEELKTYKSIRYRKEHIETVNDIEIYNDSCATVIESIGECFKFSGNINIICGGDDKLLDYATFKSVFERSNKICFLSGSGTNKMLPYVDKSNDKFLGVYETLSECFDTMMKHSKPQDKVFFSPGCSSFEKFNNEFDRGEQFTALVKTYVKTYNVKT